MGELRLKWFIPNKYSLVIELELGRLRNTLIITIAEGASIRTIYSGLSVRDEEYRQETARTVFGK